MKPGKDDKFGQTAVQLGYLSDQQVSECISIQAKMREMGIDEPLGEILVKKGYITVLQKQNILKKLGIHTSPIPGYTILGKIGQGGMGSVYKASQTSVNRTVAIKILSQVATKDKTYIARFMQEAQAAAALNHKNLISAIDVGEAGGIYYFVMEYVTGKSCREILNTKGPFDQKRVGLHHVCLRAREREQIDEIHEFAKGLPGATVVHEPREDGFAPGYYSVLLEDPDGIRLEVNFVPGKGHLTK